MPKTYGRDFRLRAIALAEVRSIPVAAKELGIQVPTLTKWVDEEPHTPALERAVNLALSELTARIADGSIRGRDLTVAYGVLRDKWARYGAAEQGPSEQSSVTAREAFFDWLFDATIEALEPEEALAATADAIRDVPTFLLKLANAESGYDEPASPHRRALLAWHSNRPEIPAGDVLAWAQAQVLAVLTEHGSLAAWHAHAMAEDAAEEAERERVGAEIRAKACALREASEAAVREARLDPETRELLQAAEAFLRESSDA